MKAKIFHRMRTNLGLSQIRIAHQTKVPLYRIQRFEQGLIQLNARELIEIKKVFGTKIKIAKREVALIVSRELGDTK